MSSLPPKNDFTTIALMTFQNLHDLCQFLCCEVCLKKTPVFSLKGHGIERCSLHKNMYINIYIYIQQVWFRGMSTTSRCLDWNYSLIKYSFPLLEWKVGIPNLFSPNMFLIPHMCEQWWTHLDTFTLQENPPQLACTTYLNRKIIFSTY